MATQGSEKCLSGAEAVSESAAHPPTASVSVGEGKGPNPSLLVGVEQQWGLRPAAAQEGVSMGWDWQGAS